MNHVHITACMAAVADVYNSTCVSVDQIWMKICRQVGVCWSAMCGGGGRGVGKDCRD